MPTPIRMPALGQTSDELKLLAWLKIEGDQVTEGEPLLEIETDKATLEVEASASGTILKQLCEPGETVLAGTTVAWVGAPGEEIPYRAPSPHKGGVQVGKNEVAPSSQRPTLGKVIATPAARALARERGIDINGLTGTGPGGRIERADVLGVEGNEVAAATPEGLDESVPKHRQAIAKRLTRAAAIPQFTLVKTIDARPALLRAGGVKRATLTHVLLQAIAAALRDCPVANRVWVDEGPRFRQFVHANVGLAIAAEDNLIVATILDPDRQELGELVSVVGRTVEDGRAGRVSSASGERAAVTLSNLGMFDIDRFDAIVDPDQTAILAVGRAVERPVITGAGVVAVPQLDLSLTVDHRTLDGAQAAKFLMAVCAQLGP